MDSSGDQHLRVDHDIFKHRLDLEGNPLKETEPIKEIVAVSPSNKNTTCGSCYGAEHNSTQFVSYVYIYIVYGPILKSSRLVAATLVTRY